MIRAKMICNTVTPAPYGGGQVVCLNPVYCNKDGSLSAENKAFTDATPSGMVQLHISGTAPAFNAFKQGGAYYVDFSEAPA